ncbi:UPF0061-domain-containing protein [Aulographum hederae CBS 113979]|uniref:Selenoprotein O n=1 Tax=Aulographum hederae CBS 113979 TaxID=1176131 RepID=A0A6G1HCE4_9PEZI|nr:UPF0061-domain-containing protein [Aulographum hederae CBS 113979]
MSTTTTTNGTSSSSAAGGTTLKDLPKSSVFTTNLPADAAFPTPADSHKAPRKTFGPRMVKEALYTYVRPDGVDEYELLGVSEAAMRDIGLRKGEEETEEFRRAVAGDGIVTWDEETGVGIYPWAQCYGGYQFGQWAGQLGDGRAISLFETTNPATSKRYEIQLKGAGLTPYSRFADGRAVLRSSIREFIVSEALNALGIPTTRALSLTLLPETQVRRERMEPGAIVCRFAETWIRIGTFDLPRARGDRKLLRQLATYVAEHVYGGWENLPAAIPASSSSSDETDSKKKEQDLAAEPSTGVPSSETQGEGKDAQNRFTRLYRAIVRRNAKTVAAWQAYGFMNGVLNTDNTSILGLSLDFGPFAFFDAFDPSYTPNHDDHALRYSYKNQPSIVWWNLVRLGEALGELLGAGEGVDADEFVEKGIKEEAVKQLVETAETAIETAGEEYKAVFMAEYKHLMTRRLGLKTFKDQDFDSLFSEWLDLLEAHELDFNQSFRKLANIRVADLVSEDAKKEAAGTLFRSDGELSALGGGESAARERIAKWLDGYRARVLEDWETSPGADVDAERKKAMDGVNPRFVPKSWVLDEVIEAVEKKGEKGVLEGAMRMALSPFEEEGWGWDGEIEERWCGDVPKYRGQLQCSCSS